MIILEVPPAIWKCPRVAALDAFCTWLWAEQRTLLGLPPEVLVSVRAGRQMGRRAVGQFIVEETFGVFPDAFWLVVAIGATRQEDEADWASRLTTVPHELVHVGQFVATFGGRTPAAVARSAGKRANRLAIDAAFAPWSSVDHEAGGPASPEMIARRLTDAYHDANPAAAARPNCSSSCGCRPR